MFMSRQQLAFLGALLSGGSAFNVQPAVRTVRPKPDLAPSVPRTQAPSALFMADVDDSYPSAPSAPSTADVDDSYPSDSSEDARFTVEPEADAGDQPTAATESAVASIVDRLPSSVASSGELSAEDRASINEAILRLEALNPTEDPAYSPLINGVWALRYAGGYSEPKIPSPTRDLALFLYSGGYSPGLFALSLAQKLPEQLVEIGEVEILISREQPRIEATVGVTLFGGSEETVEVKARLEVDSGLRFTETYESASVLGQTVDIPEALQYSRELYASYVDDDILVVRDGAGVPEILVRK